MTQSFLMISEGHVCRSTWRRIRFYKQLVILSETKNPKQEADFAKSSRRSQWRNWARLLALSDWLKILIFTFIEPRNTAIPSGKLCKLMPTIQSGCKKFHQSRIISRTVNIRKLWELECQMFIHLQYIQQIMRSVKNMQTML